MGHNKTDSLRDNFDAFVSWARGVRRRLYLRDRSGLLTKEEKGEDKKRAELMYTITKRGS